jgi:hypothetical protein
MLQLPLVIPTIVVPVDCFAWEHENDENGEPMACDLHSLTIILVDGGQVRLYPYGAAIYDCV